MIARFILLSFVFCTLIATQVAAKGEKQKAQSSAATQGIVAVVNDDVITVTDLNKRMALILASSGLPNSSEIKQKLAPQVVNGLIEEQLMMQEASRMEITIEPAEIEEGFNVIAKQNNMDGAKFKAMLQKSGIDLKTMERQIRAQYSWGKVVQARLRPKVSVSERDIDDALQRIKSKAGASEYLVAEIFLPVDAKNKEDQVMQLAKKLVSEIKGGKASFFKLAQQFSKSPGSSKGGDVGWLQENQIEPEILNALKAIKKGQATAPVRTPMGVHILFLRDVRTLTDATLPSRDQILHNLGTERLDRLQRRHLMDIKASSFIDIRV